MSFLPGYSNLLVLPLSLVLLCTSGDFGADFLEALSKTEAM